MKIRKTGQDEREVYKYSFQVRTENGGCEKTNRRINGFS